MEKLELIENWLIAHHSLDNIALSVGRFMQITSSEPSYLLEDGLLTVQVNDNTVLTLDQDVELLEVNLDALVVAYHGCKIEFSRNMAI